MGISEFQLVAINPRTHHALVYPRRSTDRLRSDIREMRATGLFFVALAIFDQTVEYSYSFPRWLESRHAIGYELEKDRRASRNYRGLVDVYMRVSPGPRAHQIEVNTTTGKVKVLGLELCL